MGLMAVALDPANIGYRINVANILVAMGQGKNAVNVARETAKLAKTPAENQAAQNELVRVLQYADYQERVGGRTQEIKDETSASQIEVTSSVVAPRPLLQKQFVPSGPHHFLVGVLKNVRCADSGMDLTVASGEKILPLRSDNYYKIEFTALNVQLRGDLKPCTDLENRPAKVEYVDSADKSDIPHLIAVEIHK
jgi:hypothetical protein